MDDFATSLSDPATLLSMVVAVAMFMTIVGVMLPALKGDKLETRLKQVSSQREKLRRASRAQLEQKGIKREAKASAGIIGCLPFAVAFMVYLTTPTYIMELFTSSGGHTVLFVGFCLYAIGITVMRKMINFDF